MAGDGQDGAPPGVAILTDPGGPVLASTVALYLGAQIQGLRSSPTPEGRCWDAIERDGTTGPTGCDPHRPRRAGAGLHGSQ